MSAQEAHQDISRYLMRLYNWIRPHQFNGGLAPAVAEAKLNAMFEINWLLQFGINSMRNLIDIVNIQ